MTEEHGRLRRAAIRFVTDDNLDLYVLAVAALAFTVLGAVGVSDVKTLSSVLLALLALLAFSQIRSRRQVLDVANTQKVDPSAIFNEDFPPDLVARRSAASNWLVLIGESLTRTVSTTRNDMLRVLNAGGVIRILLLDPTDRPLLRAARTGRKVGLINRSLDDLEGIRADTKAAPGRLEIRIANLSRESA